MRLIQNFSLMLVLLGMLIGGDLSADERKIMPIYIDPSFGGKEFGPIFYKKHIGKNITLDIAQKIKMLLVAKGIEANLSRDKDTFVAIEERLAIAKMKNAGLYLSISVSKNNKDCIHIYYPNQKSDIRKNKKEELSTIIERTLKKSVAKGSYRLAELILRSIKERAMPICINLQQQSDYLLDNMNSPIVAIDFGILDSNKESLYIIDSVLMDNILNAISEAVAGYFSKREGQPLREK